MKRTSFDPAADLILVQGRVFGPSRPRRLRLAVDTAATFTLVVPEVLADIGYQPEDLIAKTSITSALGREPGYVIAVARFSVLGFSAFDFAIHAHDLGEGAGVDGLVGLNFLRLFNYQIRSVEGQILVERAA